ncbi:MAG: tRNA preQ1(34) S-adenosylmethionine ribosyltransferase-isomerase QueA [Chloroflexi bacterium HGW-Chloroflexi-3]|nr:MAG: tRNA preQ1(34) S-adenosylmethionine ribosyltransferase-isomerase QueA [Chloroflexi bacterium HGW-Chloroflexi-3]
MKTEDFNYHLPEERIAQTPIEPRDHSRLLVWDRKDENLLHRKFYEIEEFLNPGDLLVINQTRVIPARLFARKPNGGKVEIILLKKRENDLWECLVGGKRVNAGLELSTEVDIKIKVIENLEGSERLIQFNGSIDQYLPDIGQMPLPPYIHTPLQDQERYQTVFAKETGSAAAPTAGLHFTNELMDKLTKKGIQFCQITLHVGLDTFAPVTEDDPEKHKIHTEWCEINNDSADLINQTSKNGGRIIAVGTTSVRTLETGARYARDGEVIGVYTGPTNIFILPGYEFKVVQAMITNFHLPKSSLIMLVSAFTGREKILELYQKAIDDEYRFYSFGDAMLIL